MGYFEDLVKKEPNFGIFYGKFLQPTGTTASLDMDNFITLAARRIASRTFKGFMPPKSISGDYVKTGLNYEHLTYISLGLGINLRDKEDQSYMGLSNIAFTEEAEAKEPVFVVCADDLGERINWIVIAGEGEEKDAWIHKEARLGTIWRSNSTLMPLDRIVQYIPGYGRVDEVVKFNKPGELDEHGEYGWELKINRGIEISILAIVQVYNSSVAVFIPNEDGSKDYYQIAVALYDLQDFAIIHYNGKYYVYVVVYNDDIKAMETKFYEIPGGDRDGVISKDLTPPVNDLDGYVHGYRASETLEVFEMRGDSFKKYSAEPIRITELLVDPIDEWARNTNTGYEIKKTWKWLEHYDSEDEEGSEEEGSDS